MDYLQPILGMATVGVILLSLFVAISWIILPFILISINSKAKNIYEAQLQIHQTQLEMLSLIKKTSKKIRFM